MNDHLKYASQNEGSVSCAELGSVSLEYPLAKDDDAIADFNKAIELKSDLGKAFYYRGQCKNYKGDKTGSAADVKKSEQLGFVPKK